LSATPPRGDNERNIDDQLPARSGVNSDQTEHGAAQSEREALPIEFREFSASVRDVFRELKKLILFVNKQKYAGAAIVMLTFLLVLATFIQSIVVYLQIEPLKRSAETSQRQLEMIDRPWIKDSVTSGWDFRFDGNVVMWNVNIRAENIGHSVATGIYPWAKLIVINVAKDNPIDGPRRQMKELCDSIDQKFDKLKSDPTMWVNSSFPSYWLEFPFGVFLTPQQIKSSFDGGANLGASIYPELIECVEYHYPNSDRPHHAGSVYILSHSDDPTIQEAGRVFFSIGKTIPKDKMVLLKSAQYAD
jgi:hypothetical protein